MKPRIGYFFWILILAFGLIILVLATQILTKRNINGLKKGNREAVVTFTINNRLEDLVNICFELQNKVINSPSVAYGPQSLTDSLAILGYNVSALESININNEVATRFKKLKGFINQQIELCLGVLQSTGPARIHKIDTLNKLKTSDSVYVTALGIQKYLEKDLQATLNSNTEASGKLTDYNSTLAIIAITAILVLGTIIINRHLHQVRLIAALEKATEEAKKSALIKDQFLANMSHEIRTPLNAIKGFSHLITQTALNTEQQQYATIINNASGSLIHIVNDILDISKIEAGKLRIESKIFDLYKLLQTIEFMFLHAAAEKKLAYSQHINESVPQYIKGDPERLSQILINLVSNGIKFTSAGHVHTIVSMAKSEDDNVRIKFVVEDTGVGIPADKKEKIFQRFEQLDTTQGNITEGTGLGLSIVRNLVGLMNGGVSVFTEYGKGSVFIVELPFEKINYAGFDNNEINKNIIASYSYKGSSVLVVEDNKVNQLLLKHILTKLDIVAEIVSNGQEALDVLSRKIFDLVLMDIQMPFMDGYAAIEIIRHKAFIKTPVVAMTAYAMPGEKQKCLEAGMNGYIAKPVDFSELIKILDEFLLPEKLVSSEKKNNLQTQEGFLLRLAGGDTGMARLILQEIKNEIPSAINRLRHIKGTSNSEEIKNICHHMVSTFSPMGDDTLVMKKIQQLSTMEPKDDTRNSIEELVSELTKLEVDIEDSIEAMA